jgi:hypothetical protein
VIDETVLEIWSRTIGVLALKAMAEDMPGGTYGRGKEEVRAWLWEHRRDVLEESYQLTVVKP